VNIKILNSKEYAEYNKDYFVSKDGEVYSVRSNMFLKHSIDCNGYHRIDVYGKHIKIHKMVWIAWMGKIPEGFQINHKNDNKNDNSLSNLYLGNQKQNIQDCINNNHRVGNIKTLTLKDKYTGTITTYRRCKDFLDICEHSCVSGSFSKVSKTNWFNERYEIIT